MEDPQLVETNLTTTQPLPQTHSNKRKLSDMDLHTSSYLKIRAFVGQLRPYFIQVLQTTDYRNCKAAHELRKQMKVVMDLCKQMTTDTEVGKVLPECQPFSAESMLGKQSWDGRQEGKLPQTKLSSEKSAEKKHPASFNLHTKVCDSRIRGSYIVGGSVFGWNFITCAGSGPVYYGVTKESFRNAHKKSRTVDLSIKAEPLNYHRNCIFCNLVTLWL